MILGTTLAASTLLTVGTLLGHVLGGLADLAGTRTTRLGTLLSAVTNTMTLFAAEHAGDGNALDGHDVLRTVALDVTDFFAVTELA